MVWSLSYTQFCFIFTPTPRVPILWVHLAAMQIL